MTTRLNHLRNRGIAFRAMVLSIAVLAVLVLISPVAFHLGGAVALASAALAGVLCLAGAAAALAAGRLLRGPHRVLAALMAGTAARMGVPLAFGLAIHLQGGPLAKAGLLYYILAFYPVTLTIDTVLSLPEARQPAPSGPSPSHPAL